MICLSNDVSQQHRIRGTGLVRMETAKSKSDFVILNSRRLSNDYDVRFFSTNTTLSVDSALLN